MSVYKAKINTNGRHDLVNEIPLSTPYVIQIDPANICNFKCRFCPTGVLKSGISGNSKQKGLLDFEVLKKVINDLSGFDSAIKCVKLWKDGEPLLNPNLADMIKYVKCSGMVEKIELTTNGSLLTPELSHEIVEAGLNRIIISLEGLSSQYYSTVAGVKIDFERLIEQITILFSYRKSCTIHVKMIDTGICEREKNTFLSLFSPIADELFVEKAVPCWPGFDNIKANAADQNVWGETLIKKEVCPLPFYSMAININGDVSMCCNDWQQKIIAGNIINDTLPHIWRSEATHKFQLLQLEKKRKQHPICSLCSYPDYVAIDVIDNYTPELLSKFKQMN